jgi:hypothetical protein
MDHTTHYYRCESIAEYNIWEHHFTVSKTPFVKDDDIDTGCFKGINQSSYWVVYFFFENYVQDVYAFPTRKLAYEKFVECQKILQDKSIKASDDGGGIDLIFLNRDGQLSYSECAYDHYAGRLDSVDKTWAYVMEEVHLY